MTDRKSNHQIRGELITKLTLGHFEIFSFVENRCYLDGGSMYGVIPKSLWSKLAVCDENNLIPLDTNLVLIKAHGKTILVECGLGDLLSDLERKIYACETASRMNDCLSRLGVSPDMLDYVILTHLHLDHVNGAFAADQHGNPRPRFPNARHIIRREGWDTAMNPDDRSRVVYPTSRLKCLEESGLVELIETDSEILPGIRVIVTGGHTPGHQIVAISSGERTVLCTGDLIPTIGHLRPTYIAASDLYPLDTLEHKKKLITDIIEHGWIIAFDHDLDYKFATLTEDEGRTIPEKVGEPLLAVLRSCRDNIDESRKARG